MGAVVAELNRQLSREGLMLELVRWESDARPGMGRAQGIINEQIGQYDVFVGIMWRRFGTPTGVAASGTAEEFKWAHKRWKETRSPKILYYFCEAPAPPPRTVEEAAQLLEVAKFRKEVASTGLTWPYPDPAHFDDVVRPHLFDVVMDEFSTPDVPFQASIEAIMDEIVDACRANDVQFATPSILARFIRDDKCLASRSFEEAKAGATKTIRGVLDRHFEDTADRSSFVDLRWQERPDMRRAQRIALQGGEGEVAEKHILLGLLEGSSSTVGRLRSDLFTESEYCTLLESVRRGPSRGAHRLEETVDPPRFRPSSGA